MPLLPCLALHTMMADEDSTELFKNTYTHLISNQQDLATRWLDLGNTTLLYRYAILWLPCLCDLDIVGKIWWDSIDLSNYIE